jgi:hypothetical protein
MKKLLLVSFLLLGACAQREVVYSTIYPNLTSLQSPLVLNTRPCEWTYPIVKDEKVFIGLDEEQFRCYIENQEIQREQRKLYENFVKKVNEERAEWNKLNKGNK